MTDYYRIEDRVTGSTTEIVVVELNIMYRTAKGVWIKSKEGGNTFFIRDSNPRPSASKTLDGAVALYLERKARSRGILARKLEVLDNLVVQATALLTAKDHHK